MLNTATIVGRIVKDPELKKTQSGKNVMSNRIACDRNYKNQEGGYDADFFNFTAWQNTAEYICRNCKKGDLVTVNGAFRNRNWTDKEGNKHYDIVLEVGHVDKYYPKKGEDATEEVAVETPEPIGAIEDEDPFTGCFLQALFGENCKLKKEKFASPFWRKLQGPYFELFAWQSWIPDSLQT